MGMDCSAGDMANVMAFTERMVKLAEYRVQLHRYLVDKMQAVAPNLSTLVGDSVAARLISKAGSLTSLAKCPASTVQILGAEKALFRALKKKGNTPKYGLIFHSTFIGRAGTKNKGRISRYLANKAAIASRIDCFSDEPSTKFGEKLREQVEERLEFYDTGKTPRKNLDVMREVIGEVDGGRKRKAADEGDQTEDADVSKTLKKKKDKGEKKSKKSEKGSKKVKGDKKEKKSKKEKEGKKKSKKSKKEAMEVE